MPGVHHSSEGCGKGLLTIRFISWFWIICPSGFKFFLASSLLAGPRRGWSPAFLLSFLLSLSFPSLSPPFSFSTVYICLFLFPPFHLFPLLHLPLFPSLLHLFPTWPHSSSSCSYLSLFSVLLTVSGPLKRKCSGHPNRDHCCFSQGNQTAKNFLSPSPEGDNLTFNMFFKTHQGLYIMLIAGENIPKPLGVGIGKPSVKWRLVGSSHHWMRK